MTKKPPHPQRFAAFRVLHSQGWLDTEMAAAFDTRPDIIRVWRNSESLPNNRGFNRINSEIAMGMYLAGSNDREIAHELGVDPSSVCTWRKNRSLPCQVNPSQIPEATKRYARKLLRQGASRAQVAQEIGFSKKAVQSIRSKMTNEGLRRVGVSGRTIRSRVLKDRSLLPRIRKAIGDHVPQHIREDAVADLYAAVFEGRIAADQIEKRAPAFRSRAYSMCGSAFGPISLDAENEDGLRLIDSISDPTAETAMSEWYEEAGD